MYKAIRKMNLVLVLILSTLVTIVNPQSLPIQSIVSLPPVHIFGGIGDSGPEVGVKIKPKDSGFSMLGKTNVDGHWIANIGWKKDNVDISGHAKNVGNGVEAGVRVKIDIGGSGKSKPRRRSWFRRVFRG
ncbi:uncharacterized protein LOC133201103 [Saccostrea echinata]|uniref:uncharacterized protein LOC133201103 n=1 Tax=Saccostrea echinata TaxID=191078 RepID=UPI002A83F075|nr:uncharacterized protein LOC133201103 [Saccostrea echinata]